MEPIMNSICPRCGENFQCGAKAEEATCWCYDLPHIVPLEGIRFANEPAYTGCLCPNCLQAFINAPANTVDNAGDHSKTNA